MNTGHFHLAKYNAGLDFFQKKNFIDNGQTGQRPLLSSYYFKDRKLDMQFL